jgi:hypothetical protein
MAKLSSVRYSSHLRGIQEYQEHHARHASEQVCRDIDFRDLAGNRKPKELGHDIPFEMHHCDVHNNHNNSLVLMGRWMSGVGIPQCQPILIAAGIPRLARGSHVAILLYSRVATVRAKVYS